MIGHLMKKITMEQPINKINYEKVFYTLVRETENYCNTNNIQSLVLGISGGIDSTVVAAIAREVCDKINIPLIGRSLPIKNKKDEFHTSKLVGEAFCDDFKIINLASTYTTVLYEFSDNDCFITGNSISNGNIQARLRMIYLYNLASINDGMVLSTDNQTEYQLGFWTIHGDVGDYDPIQALWKTEVYGLANWLLEYYDEIIADCDYQCLSDDKEFFINCYNALSESIRLTPTDGLGISNSDLDQIGAKSYEEIDEILQTLLEPKNQNEHLLTCEYLKNKYSEEVINKIWDRHLKSEFKRLKSPISIERSKII